MSEFSKMTNNLAPPIMNMFTPRENNFNLIERNETVKCDLETVSYRCP